MSEASIAAQTRSRFSRGTQHTMIKKNTLLARLALAVAALTAAHGLQAQTLRVTAANSSASNAVYDVLFSPAGTALLNSDGSAMGSFRSLVFVAGSAGHVDLVVADSAAGAIVRYVAPTGTPIEPSIPVWSAASGVPGPQHPDGLSVDAAGNVYAATSLPKPSLWVLQPSAAAPGGFQAPLLLDAHFSGHEVDSLVDTLIVPNTLPASVMAALAANGIHAGDLLVLIADDDFDPSDRRERVTVFDYSAASIAAFLANPAKSIAPPCVALLEHQFPETTKRSSPLPAGFDIWPIDGSLLLSTTRGTILQYALPSSASSSGFWTNSYATTFAVVSCGYGSCPFGKLRAGTQAGAAYAFVTQSTGNASGNILQFAVPLTTSTPSSGFGFTIPTAVVATSASATADSTTGSPEGLALAPQTVVVASASTCASSAGCNPTGGLAANINPGPAGVGPQGVHGNIIQQSCIVTDTRLQADGSCPGNLNVAQLCPGFPANIIPPKFCGASGPAKNQLAIINSVANGVDDVPGILVQSEESPSNLIPGTPDQPCASGQVVGWSPRLGSDEGVIPEGAEVLDMTTFCDKDGSSTRGNSVWVIGTELSSAIASNTRTLVGFTNDKFATLGKTIASANIARPVQDVLGLCLVTSAVLLNTGHYSCAARNVWLCDQVAAAHAKGFGSSPDNPNPFGDVRGRLGNIFFTINSRIAKNPPNTAWPLTSPPPACK
jgi:hypothetical protein